MSKPFDNEAFLEYVRARGANAGEASDAADSSDAAQHSPQAWPQASSQESLDDLRIAFLCAQGDATAIADLHQNYLRGVDPHLLKLGLDHSEVDDVKQLMLRNLLVATDEAPARITQFDGRGPLRAWLRVAAVREGLKVLRKKKNQVPYEEGHEDRQLAERALPADPELSYMKALYRDAFRQAFRAAVISLDARQKTLLRQSLIDGLTIDDLARLYGTHRATAARWVQAARETVVHETRRHFITELKVSDAECESVFRLIGTHLDVTLRRHLV